jgi:hypothetical protein
MNKILLGSVVALFFLCNQAQAQAWQQEPVAVFGLKLGEPLTASDIPMCPPYRPGYGLPDALCIEKMSGPYAEKMATLNALPINEVYSASVHLQNSQVSSLHLDFKHDHYAKLRAILIERYGPPTKSSIAEIKTRTGLSVPAETLEWVGKKNSLRLFERFQRIDKSLAAFTNNDLSQQAGLQAQDKVRESASKF